jgi:hypothetical protein
MTKRQMPTGLAPSNDPPTQNRRKVAFGRGAITVIGAIAIGAFALYAIIVIYGVLTAS